MTYNQTKTTEVACPVQDQTIELDDRELEEVTGGVRNPMPANQDSSIIGVLKTDSSIIGVLRNGSMIIGVL